jgi:hypothetical protein
MIQYLNQRFNNANKKPPLVETVLSIVNFVLNYFEAAKRSAITDQFTTFQKAAK